MHVVELDVDDVLDPVRAELAKIWFGNGGRWKAECDTTGAKPTLLIS
jgi:hypothetical protein